jgi:hypothetical protein
MAGLEQEVRELRAQMHPGGPSRGVGNGGIALAQTSTASPAMTRMVVTHDSVAGAGEVAEGKPGGSTTSDDNGSAEPPSPDVSGDAAAALVANHTIRVRHLQPLLLRKLLLVLPKLCCCDNCLRSQLLDSQ